MGLEDLRATEAAWNESRSRTLKLTSRVGAIGTVAITALSAPAVWLSDKIYTGSAHVAVTSTLMGILMVPLMLVVVHERKKQLITTDELMQRLQPMSFHQATEAAQTHAQRRENQFDARNSKPASPVRSRWPRASPRSSRWSNGRSAVPCGRTGGGPAGGQQSCPRDTDGVRLAYRRTAALWRGLTRSLSGGGAGHRSRFTDSEDLDACPKLHGRRQGPCSAVCVPVSIIGRTVGVIHTTGQPGAEFEEDTVAELLATLANLAGACASASCA